MTLTQINKAGLDELALDHVFTIGASGSSAYTFQGEGLNGTVNNPTLYLTRGKTYRFENGSGGHPIRIQSTSGASGTAYNTGVTNNAGSGTVIVEVQHDAPDVLYYQCTSHAAMNGILYITGALADNGVTTAKLANNAVTSAKIADSNVTNAKLAGDIPANKLQVNDAHIIIGDASADGTLQTLSGDVSMTRTGAVTIADQAVTLAKLEHGTSSNDGKFLRANNGADPTFETVSTDLVADTSPQLGGALDTNGNNINFGDSTGGGSDDRLTFGASQDLQIYHNGSHSRIVDEGTGKLQLGSDTEIEILNGSFNETMAKFTPNGNVELYHDNTKRFSTSSAGFNLKEANNTRLSFTYGSNLVFITANQGNEVKFSCGNGDANGIEFWDYSGVNKRCQIDAEGIKFNADTAAANGLDDYEEGTWTPTIQGPGGTGTHGAGNAGFYTKIGNTVHAHATIHWTAISGTTNGVVVVLGLPYATKNASHYRSTSLMGGQVVGVHNGANAAMNIGIGVDANQSFAYITGINGSSTASYNYTHQPTVNSTGHIFGFALTYLTN